MTVPCTIFCSIICIGCFLYCTGQPEATPPVGRIRGSVLRSRLGREIYTFRGIRYGVPPVGERRFQIAIPPEDWNDDVFDATEEGPACPNLQKKQPVSEDCLRLNVYTTKLTEDVKRPVMVFFHPGGFLDYSAQSYIWGPEYLLDKDVVLVTLNYRLATLGFISTGDELAPGNLGLKDQVAALRWVQRNIRAFGGDPNSVTICGYSAGSCSILLHLLSPMSKNLFHRVIMMSGAYLINQPYPTEQVELARKQARLLNCTTENNKAMISCLKTKPVENFQDTIQDFHAWHLDPVVVWQPVVEPEYPGAERFLTGQPIDLVREGKFYHVPIIIGMTRDELGYMIVLFTNRTRDGDDWYKDMNDHWYRIAPQSFLYEYCTSRANNISTELRQFYFKNQPVSPATNDSLAHIYSDSVIIFPTYRMSKLLAENSKAPVYLYKFTYQGRYSFTMWNATTPYGIVHQDDLQYLFYIQRFPFFDKNAPEIPMVELYTSMWTSFVETGEPVPKSGQFQHIKWNRLVAEEDNYLEINLTPTMKNGIYPDRMQEWEKVFPLSQV